MIATASRTKRSGPPVKGGSTDARVRAAAILDVLGGGRTPADAAVAIGVSLHRYFALEVRALEGLVKACEPRPRGARSRPADKEIAMLRREVERLKRDCTRQQAVIRAAQRMAGLAAPSPKPHAKRKRKPVARASKAALVLRSEPVPAPASELVPAT